MMPKTKIALAFIAMCAASLFTAGVSRASDNPALDADLHQVELKWEHVKFQEAGAPSQMEDMAAVAKQAESIAAKYPGRAEPLIWKGIAVSEEAGLASMLHAMGYAKQAKKILEDAYKIDPSALDAGAPTCLGVLYYRVPGFPVGFGDTSKARLLLKQAVSLSPDGMDANYFYADFLMSEKDYANAAKVLKHALSLPERSDRPLWDSNRRGVMRDMLAKAEAQK